MTSRRDEMERKVPEMEERCDEIRSKHDEIKKLLFSDPRYEEVIV